jgi:hypothetical protein
LVRGSYFISLCIGLRYDSQRTKKGFHLSERNESYSQPYCTVPHMRYADFREVFDLYAAPFFFVRTLISGFPESDLRASGPQRPLDDEPTRRLNNPRNTTSQGLTRPLLLDNIQFGLVNKKLDYLQPKLIFSIRHGDLFNSTSARYYPVLHTM